jgi:hypothetical protein
MADNIFTWGLYAPSATLTNATITNLSALGSISLGTTTMYGSLVPNASTTYHTLGTLANPWSELFVSSSSVFIGGTKISNDNGLLTWGGENIVTTNGTSSEISLATVNASTSNASSSIIDVATITSARITNLDVPFGTINQLISGSITATSSLSALNASITTATTTNLFASIFSAVDAFFANLTANNATMTNATSTNLVSTGMASLANLFTGNATATNFSTTGFTFSSSNGTKLVVGEATTTNLFTHVFNSLNAAIDKAVIVDATTTNSTSTNLFAANLSATIASLFNLNFTNATGTNATTSNFATTNITSTGTAMFANILATNATITDISTGRLTNDGGTLVLGTESNNYTQFIQNGLEVMRIKTTGEISMANSLSVGRDTASYLLHVGSSTMSSGIVARFTNADGNCNVDPFSGVSCTSDERLKKNIEKTDFSAVEKLNQVAVREYNMLRQVDGSPKQVGFIAQNLETIFPWLVSTDEEAV